MAGTEIFVPRPSKTQSRINYDLEAGVMTEKITGKRVIWMPEDFTQAMIRVSSRMLRSGAPVMFYKMGFYWGQAMFRELESHILATRPHIKRIPEMPVKDFVTYVDEIWAQNGLGRFELVQNYDRIFINLYFSFFPRVVEKTGKPMDHIYAGLYSGLFSGLLGQDVGCVEIMCVSSGYDYCSFLLGKEESLEAVRDWVEDGVSYEAIIERIQNGEGSGPAGGPP